MAVAGQKDPRTGAGKWPLGFRDAPGNLVPLQRNKSMVLQYWGVGASKMGSDKETCALLIKDRHVQIKNRTRTKQTVISRPLHSPRPIKTLLPMFQRHALDLVRFAAHAFACLPRQSGPMAQPLNHQPTDRAEDPMRSHELTCFGQTANRKALFFNHLKSKGCANPGPTPHPGSPGPLGQSQGCVHGEEGGSMVR